MKIKINGLNWTVENVHRNDEHLIVRGNPCFGVTHYADLIIWLDKTQAKELYRQTLIHELIHAYTFSFGVHLVANEKTEESVCDFMGSHLDEIYLTANKIMDDFYGKAVK